MRREAGDSDDDNNDVVIDSNSELSQLHSSDFEGMEL